MSFFDDNNEPVENRIADAFEKIGQALRQHAWRKSSPHGLTPTQGRVLAFLRQQRGATLNEVSHALGVRAATASGMVRTLEHRGLVSKSRRVDDGRTLELRLTVRGKSLATRAVQWSEVLAEVAAELGEEELRVLLRAVLGMIRGLQQRGHVQQARMCLTCQFFKPYAHRNRQRPHHCLLVDEAFGDLDLRVECEDQIPASDERAAVAWQAFTAGGIGRR